MRTILIIIVRLYQAGISPLFPPVCRFHPTCSEYFIRAVERRGWIRGTLLGLYRVLRCNPFSKGGYDPV